MKTVYMIKGIDVQEVDVYDHQGVVSVRSPENTRVASDGNYIDCREDVGDIEVAPIEKFTSYRGSGVCREEKIKYVAMTNEVKETLGFIADSLKLEIRDLKERHRKAIEDLSWKLDSRLERIRQLDEQANIMTDQVNNLMIEVSDANESHDGTIKELIKYEEPSIKKRIKYLFTGKI